MVCVTINLSRLVAMKTYCVCENDMRYQVTSDLNNNYYVLKCDIFAQGQSLEYVFDKIYVINAHARQDIFFWNVFRTLFDNSKILPVSVFF